MKDGAIIHVERGYRIAEVLEQLGDDCEMRCVGFRLIGARADATHVYTTEQQARDALAELARHDPPG